MRIIKLSATIFAIGLFLMACNQPQQTSNVGVYPASSPLAEPTPDETDYYAKDNLDLQRVGNLVERSKNPQEFERYLNTHDGINNLDLNGDGYVDYISVDEFDDRGDYERGLSLYARFGPDVVQEVGTIVFYREDFRAPGAMILVTGNEQIYGDNFYYETNWVDRTIGLVSLLFSPRTVYYHSPYYYDYYPPDYVVYEVVDFPFYRTRIERLYPQPVFVFTSAPTFISKIKIKSPHYGKWMDKVHAKLAKPTKEQSEFKKNNPGKPERVKLDKGGDKPGKSGDAGRDKQPKEDIKVVGGDKQQPPKPAKADRPNANPQKADQGGKQPDKGQKPDQGGKGKGKGKP